MPSQRTFSQLVAAALCLCGSVSAETKGTFDFLTFNVAGLPAILNDNGVPGDKKTNAGTIGALLALGGYDVVQMQEDFNYHAYIYKVDTHEFRTPTSGGVPFGDGLNTVSNHNWTAFTREKWEECNLSSADCLTPKGISYMHVTIDGAEIDFYNVHADAGRLDWDADVRDAGIDQLLRAIDKYSAGRPAILAGDFNDLWTNEKQSVGKLTAAGFTDTWVKLIKGGTYPKPGDDVPECGVPAENANCETLDKVFYRSGDSVKLAAKSFAYKSDEFQQPNGDILSDHNPLLVEFEWST